CLPLLVAGIGVSMALPTTAAAAVGAVPAQEIGTAAGGTNTFPRFGGALGVAVLSTVLFRDGHLGLPASFLARDPPSIHLAPGPRIGAPRPRVSPGDSAAHCRHIGDAFGGSADRGRSSARLSKTMITEDRPGHSTGDPP